jgi:GDP-4-dehydro-6-deoxy-D-mannose reductase
LDILRGTNISQHLKKSIVLITGRNGFIGNHLYKYLAKKQIEIIDGDEIEDKKSLDVTDLQTLLSINKHVQTIIHLAAKTSIVNSFHDPYLTYYTNFVGTFNLLEFARLKNVKKLINISTYVYGHPQYNPVDENHPIDPHSPYNKSKLLADQLCRFYSCDFGIDIVTLRPFYIYGPGASSDSFIPSIVRQIKQTGEVTLNNRGITRDFLFVDDFIYLITTILSKFPRGYNVFNVGSGTHYTLEEVTRIVAELLDKEVNIQYNKTYTYTDVSTMQADITKISNAFKWKPIVNMEKGLRLTVDAQANL